MLMILLDGAVLRLSLIKCVIFTYSRLILKNNDRTSGRFIFGGEGGIRTPAPVARPKALAKPPLRPLGYFSLPAKE